MNCADRKNKTYWFTVFQSMYTRITYPVKKLACAIALLLVASSGYSQKIYFVYLQTENEQPFFVKMNEAVQSSSASGYLILAKLRDSTYNISIGFPQGKWSDQQFKLEIKGNDHGYLLKNFGEKWGLFDLQTLGVQMSAASTSRSSGAQSFEVSAFTEILSRAANDPTLKERPIAAKQEEKLLVAQPAVLKEEKEPVKDPVVVKPDTAAIARVTTQDAVATGTLPKVSGKPDSLVKKEESIVRKDPPIAEKTIAKVDTPANKEQSIAKQDPPKNATALETVAKVDTPAVKEASNIRPQDTKVTSPSETMAKVDTPAKKDEVIATKATKEEEASRKAETKTAPAPELTAKTEQPAKTEPVAVVKEEVYKPSVVKRRSESSTTEGFGLVFVDEYANGAKDTIRIVIPVSKQPNVLLKEQPKEQPKVAVKEDKKFLDITSDSKDVTVSKKEERAIPNKPVAKCVTAVESDFLKLRKRMAGQNTDWGMLSEANKYFKTRCFTAQQLKNLSALFLNDAAKLQFFEAAYPYVADASNFPSLAGELKDSYYVGRFNAILK
jgi:hypothetical protein